MNLTRAISLLAPALLCLGFAPARAADENPRLRLPTSRLAPPYEVPIYLLGHAGVGFGGVVEGVRPVGGATFVIRPGAVDRFLPILTGRGVAMVLQAEYQKVNDDQRNLSGGLLLRRYLRDLSGAGRDPIPFAGVGVGAGEVTFESGACETGWEFFAEVGQEWSPRPALLLQWQLQYRYHGYHGHDFSHFSCKFGAGMPWPW